MILAAGLLLAAVVIGIVAPRYLQFTVAPGLHPRLALTAWLGSLGVLLSVLFAVPVALFLRPGRNFLNAAHACVGRIQQDKSLPWLESAQVVLTVALVALLVRVLVMVEGRLRHHRNWSAEHLRMLRLLSGSVERHRGVEVIRIDATDPVFYSLGGGRGGAIVASSAIADLDYAQQQAILDHEEAHLRGHHHLILVVAEALAAALPFVPLCRQAPSAVRTLAEFAADHRAAERGSAEVVQSALLVLHEADAARAGVSTGVSSGAETSSAAIPSAALAMSRDAVAARLCWLGTDPTRRQRRLAVADYPLAVTVSLAPALISVLTMTLTATLLCLRLAG